MIEVTYDHLSHRWCAQRAGDASPLASATTLGRLLGTLERNVEDYDPDQLSVEPYGSPGTRRAIDAYRAARSEYDEASQRARVTLRDALLRCLAEGYVLRDAAYLLGITHQRAHQVMAKMEAGR